jgi:HD-GYP domain-containing protein (c-di-GMP phosphodiesterase class II)
LRDAAITGEDVRIPVADYLTHISGTPAEQALLQHMKADPAGPTYSEAQAYFQRDKAAIKAQAEKVAKEKTERVADEEAERTVHAELVRQFGEAQGSFRSANRADADLQLAFYKALAKRESKTVDEVWREVPLKVEGAGPSKKPEALIQHRKRVAVLEAIRECL